MGEQKFNNFQKYNNKLALLLESLMTSFDMIDLIRLCFSSATVLRAGAHFYYWLNATFDIENKQRNVMTFCFYRRNIRDSGLHTHRR